MLIALLPERTQLCRRTAQQGLRVCNWGTAAYLSAAYSYSAALRSLQSHAQSFPPRGRRKVVEGIIVVIFPKEHHHSQQTV
jgi:hypothetical protein